MNTNTKVATFCFIVMAWSPVSFSQDDIFKVTNPTKVMQEGQQRRAETEALRAQTRLLETHTRQLELEIQARQLELDRQRQSQPPTSPTFGKDAADEYRRVLLDMRVVSCIEERAISERYCLSIASNELAVGLDGYIRAEPYRSRQMQYVEARMAR